MFERLEELIFGIRALNVPRVEDLPYWTSPPIQFVYESTATLNLGRYTWADAPSALTPVRPLNSNALYYFRHVTFAANIEELDFTSNILTTPQFQMYLKSRARAPLFREPLQMVKYLDEFEYQMAWETRQQSTAQNQTSDALLGSFTGVIDQGANLIGVQSITLKAIIAAQEIIDENFINLFKTRYPANLIVSGQQRANIGRM